MSLDFVAHVLLSATSETVKEDLMSMTRPLVWKTVLSLAEWEFLEHLKAMKEARRHPDYDGDSDRAYLRQQQNKSCRID